MGLHLNVFADSIQAVEKVMIDKIYYKSEYEIIIIFTDGKPFRIYSPLGHAMLHLYEILSLDKKAA